METVYLDNAATTSLSRNALNAMMPHMTHVFGNPSSSHAMGREARSAVEKARKQTAIAIGAQNNEIYFTSCGSESDNWAVKGAAWARKMKGRHIITSAIEHHAVLGACLFLEQQGCRVTRLSVNGYGRVDPEDLAKNISNDTILISIMAANNEIGTIEPIAEIGRIAHEQGILFHVDAVQAVNALPVNVELWQADMLSLSAHKFHGPKGVGVLYIRNGTGIETLIHGGEQERGRRGGTINTAGVAGLGRAIEDAVQNREANNAHIKELSSLLTQGILSIYPEARLNGHPTERLPGIVNVSFPGIDQEILLNQFDLNGICVSGGSACASGSLEPSHVLAALDLPWERVVSSVRFSLGTTTTKEEIEFVLSRLPQVIQKAKTNC